MKISIAAFIKHNMSKSNKISFFGVVFFAWFVLFAPMFVFAASHTYTCSDWTLSNGSSCTADVLSFVASTGDALGSINTYAADTPYYVVIMDSGSGGYRFYFSNNIVSTYHAMTPGGTTEFILTPPGSSSFAYIYDMGTFTGSVTSVCISDTSFAECPGGSSPTGTTTLLATSTVDKALDITYNGVLLYVIGFWGMIWFFRKRM